VAELTLVDYFIMGEAVGIVATLFVAFYYSRKQMQKLSTDLETKVLNDLNDKLHGIAEVALARPEVGELLESQQICRLKNLLQCIFYTYMRKDFKCVREGC